MNELLSKQEVSEALPEGSAWHLMDDRLTRDYQFADFSQAFAFLTRVALAAEKAGHHPDIRNSYSKVTLQLHTHDAGGITRKDLQLARAIDELQG